MGQQAAPSLLAVRHPERTARGGELGTGRGGRVRGQSGRRQDRGRPQPALGRRRALDDHRRDHQLRHLPAARHHPRGDARGRRRRQVGDAHGDAAGRCLPRPGALDDVRAGLHLDGRPHRLRRRLRGARPPRRPGLPRGRAQPGPRDRGGLRGRVRRVRREPADHTDGRRALRTDHRGRAHGRPRIHRHPAGPLLLLDRLLRGPGRRHHPRHREGVARQVAALPPDSGETATEDAADPVALDLRPEERRGLRRSGLVFLVFLAAIVVAMIPTGSPLRGEGGSIVESPVLSGIAVVLGVLFALLGTVYGRAAGTVRGSRDIPDFMAQGMREMAPILVLFFAISQFLAYFKWTGVGQVLAIRGADLLKDLGVTGPVAFLGILVVCTVINLAMTSGSAMWALVSPVFVPMLMLLDVPPEATQAIYRIADSCTNAITPMSAYFVMALGFLQRYRRSAGIGTLASLTLPLSLAMLVTWTLLFYAWWALGIPLGPGAPVR
ncbi:efflux pump component MtrF [Streptomyces himastatinicus ATCC 53653]|uniref:Efflux pump component MtrF n=1 Tax=Streptomyces himastatinicus ATCC 53653 TaxID=457427 RepID=D9WFA3_9ACTN|nr:efflux pump component MtrF [Streptomyces himastatinicus ATCC 53653]